MSVECVTIIQYAEDLEQSIANCPERHDTNITGNCPERHDTNITGE